MKTIGYVRVSTDEQAQSGLSLSNQKSKIVGLAEVHDYEIGELIEDPGQSAASLNRPGLQKVLQLVRGRRIDSVIVLKLDRLTRSQKDLLHLLEMFDRFGVSLVSVQESLDTSSANGRFFVQLLGSIAEWERGTIRERTQSAIQQLHREKRRFTRHPPLGWRFDGAGRMIKHDSEQKTLRIIHDLHAQGLSLRKIGEELLGQGMTPRNGSAWSTSVIRNAIRSASE